ncbi:S1C family serine protease [Paenibacillus sp. YSY-4.3]
MDTVLEVLWMLAEAAGQLLLQPFYYIAIILLMLIYRRQVLLERKLFHVRLHSWGVQTWRTVLGGLLAGIFVSLVSLFTGMTLTVEGIICVWVVTLLLLLFRVRYLCLAYAVGLLGVVQFIVNLIPGLQGEGWTAEVLRVIRELNIPALLCLVAVLHVAEAFLVRWQGASFAGPLFFEGKRGKLVGGYQLQSLWPVPLFLMIPAHTTGAMLPWTPLFGGDAWQEGFQWIAFPIMIGFSEITTGLLPRAKAKVSSGRLLGYGIIMLALALLSAWWSPLTIVAALAGIALHEGLVWLSRFEEQKHSPLFVNPIDGLRVLAVLPGSPAEELGIQAGETIIKVNGTPVATKEELHAGLRMNPAFCKLEVRNLAGESKYLQRAIYAGEHHQLGAILAPDDQAPVAVRMRPISLFHLLRPRREGEQVNSGARRSAGRHKGKLADKPQPSTQQELGAETEG